MGESPLRSGLAAHVRAFFERHDLAPADRYVIGVSGGVDSVVLGRLLVELGAECLFVHVHHGLRGEEADRDAQFVRGLADALGCPVRVERVEVPSPGSLQARAREERYRVLATAQAEFGATGICVAHHEDDQIETVLMNLLRGSGPEGLAGLRPVRAFEHPESYLLIRPLLEIPRARIERYAAERGWSWLEDETNASDTYARNALRRQVVPLLEEVAGAGSVRNLARSARLMQQYLEAGWREELEARWTSCAVDRREGGELELTRLRSAPAVWRGRLLLEALRRWLPGVPASGVVVEELSHLTDAQVGRHFAHAEGTVWRERDSLRFLPPVDGGESIQQLGPGREVGTGLGSITASAPREVPAQFSADRDICWVDAGQVGWPLLVRRWRAGDRIQPFGMEGHKKIKALLTDAKVPASARERWPVVVSRGEICWVPGVCGAEWTRITSDTQRAIRLEWSPFEAYR